MSAQWPLVRTRLLALLPTLAGWGSVQVFDGAAFDAVAATFVTVAHATDGVTTHAGSYTSVQSPDGFLRVEAGIVACQMTCTDDSTTPTAPLGTVFGLLDAFDAEIRRDRRLAVLSAEGTSDLVVDIQSTQTVPGSAVVVSFSFHYSTVT